MNAANQNREGIETLTPLQNIPLISKLGLQTTPMWTKETINA